MGSLCIKPHGFSTLELLFTVAIAAVLAAMAVPGFAELRRSAAISSGANQLLWALHYARSSSLLRGVPTVVCLSEDGASCLTGAREAGSGWLVFHDVDRSSPPQIGGADEPLRSVHLPPDITVRGSRAAVTYWPARQAGTTGTFTLCATRGRMDGRAVVVSQTGRPRVAGAVTCAP